MNRRVSEARGTTPCPGRRGVRCEDARPANSGYRKDFLHGLIAFRSMPSGKARYLRCSFVDFRKRSGMPDSKINVGQYSASDAAFQKIASIGIDINFNAAPKADE